MIEMRLQRRDDIHQRLVESAAAGIDQTADAYRGEHLAYRRRCESCLEGVASTGPPIREAAGELDERPSFDRNGHDPAERIRLKQVAKLLLGRGFRRVHQRLSLFEPDA